LKHIRVAHFHSKTLTRRLWVRMSLQELLTQH